MNEKINQILSEIRETNAMSIRMMQLIKQLKTELNKQSE